VVAIESELYTFDADAVIERLRRSDDTERSVLVVGHNPALQEAATRLSADGELRRRLEAKFPTAALATIELPEGPWTSLEEGTGTLTRLVVPKELASQVRDQPADPDHR
jgi:phosphohistidine phosphatase